MRGDLAESSGNQLSNSFNDIRAKLVERDVMLDHLQPFIASTFHPLLIFRTCHRLKFAKLVSYVYDLIKSIDTSRRLVYRPSSVLVTLPSPLIIGINQKSS